jgi:DNA-binding transcriptional LysR family regulator
MSSSLSTTFARNRMNFQHLSHFELKQICYFLTLVAANNNFTEAANRLGIEQPPLTQRIQALEKLLTANSSIKVNLLDRRSRPAKLTAAGRVFLTEAELALTHLDRAITNARRASQGKIGYLRVGFYASFAANILPQLVREFQHQFPDVEVELLEIPVNNRLLIIDLLCQNQLDIILHNSFDSLELDSGCRLLPILTESFTVVLPATHPLAQQQQLDLSQVAAESIILPDVDALPFYKQIVIRCQELGFEPNIVPNVKVSGIIAILSLVAAGMGIAILPSHIQVLHHQGVVYRSLAEPKLARQAVVMWRETDEAIVLQQFLALLPTNLAS